MSSVFRKLTEVTAQGSQVATSKIGSFVVSFCTLSSYLCCFVECICLSTREKNGDEAPEKSCLEYDFHLWGV